MKDDLLLYFQSMHDNFVLEELMLLKQTDNIRIEGMRAKVKLFWPATLEEAMSRVEEIEGKNYVLEAQLGLFLGYLYSRA